MTNSPSKTSKTVSVRFTLEEYDWLRQQVRNERCGECGSRQSIGLFIRSKVLVGRPKS